MPREKVPFHNISGAFVDCPGRECPHCLDRNCIKGFSDKDYKAFISDLAARECHAMDKKRNQYGIVESNDPFAIIKRTSENTDLSLGDVWFSMEDRHLASINRDLSNKDLLNRLKDAFGYICMGIIMLEKGIELNKEP